MSKSISVLGSTGSIGVQTLQIAASRGYSVAALSANKNIKVLEEQIRAFKPPIAAVADEAAAADLKLRVADTVTKVLSGESGVCECACKADTAVNGIVGIAGLRPTLAAIESGSTLALANKESLVTGGAIVTSLAKQKGVSILPVDSEHSAIFQSLAGCRNKAQVKRLILTASGGPFFGKTRQELSGVTVEQALNHPNWSMGAKITIDSATMMNKGLELIEAAWLFDMKAKDIDIVVHRQSVVHSLVEYCDNSVIAQLGVPDMRIPIQYALTYPERFESPVRELDLTEFGNLTFEKPDYKTFFCINLCKRALDMGGLMPAAVNAANEKANELFREGKIAFLDIARLTEEALDAFSDRKGYSLEEIFDIDACVRRYVAERKMI